MFKVLCSRTLNIKIRATYVNAFITYIIVNSGWTFWVERFLQVFFACFPFCLPCFSFFPFFPSFFLYFLIQIFILSMFYSLYFGSERDTKKLYMIILVWLEKLYNWFSCWVIENIYSSTFSKPLPAPLKKPFKKPPRLASGVY